MMKLKVVWLFVFKLETMAQAGMWLKRTFQVPTELFQMKRYLDEWVFILDLNRQVISTLKKGKVDFVVYLDSYLLREMKHIYCANNKNLTAALSV